MTLVHESRSFRRIVKQSNVLAKPPRWVVKKWTKLIRSIPVDVIEFWCSAREPFTISYLFFLFYSKTLFVYLATTINRRLMSTKVSFKVAFLIDLVVKQHKKILKAIAERNVEL